MPELKAVAVGAGYFSRFHYEAWSRIDEVELAAVCDLNQSLAEDVCREFGIARSYMNFGHMLDDEQPDFVDIITRPETHKAFCSEAARRSISIICQKPLAPTDAEARRIVQAAEQAGVRFMVHENFRFQPWYREIRRLLDEGAIGERLHSLTMRSRPGDGWGDDAYLARQPYFRRMPRLLIYETGIHFIDTLRFLAGEVDRVFCHLRRLNPVITGDDCGLLMLEFRSSAVGVWDANRWNESNAEDPRYTFGELLVEADRGSIRLAADGSLTIQPLGERERMHAYQHQPREFGDGCVYATQRHFVDRLLDGKPFETAGDEYLTNLAIQEAAYQSAEQSRMIELTK